MGIHELMGSLMHPVHRCSPLLCVCICWSQPRALQKRPNQSKFHLGYGHGWAKPWIRWGQTPRGRSNKHAICKKKLLYKSQRCAFVKSDLKHNIIVKKNLGSQTKSAKSTIVKHSKLSRWQTFASILLPSHVAPSFDVSRPFPFTSILFLMPPSFLLLTSAPTNWAGNRLHLRQWLHNIWDKKDRHWNQQDDNSHFRKKSSVIKLKSLCYSVMQNAITADNNKMLLAKNVNITYFVLIHIGTT